MKPKFLYFALILAALLLSACGGGTVSPVDTEGSSGLQITTIIKSDESGQMIIAYGPDYEQAVDQNIEDICDELRGINNEVVKFGNDQWCVSPQEFDNLIGLRRLYENLEINVYFAPDPSTLRVRSNELTYEVTINNYNPYDITWRLVAPGSIKKENASSQQGSLLTWTIKHEDNKTIEVLSGLGGGGLNTTTTLVILLISCLCLLVLAAAGVGAFFFIRKRKANPIA